MRGDDPVQHDVLRDFVAAGLDHDDLFGRGRDRAEHLALCAFLGGGVDDIFTVKIAEPDARDRLLKRDVGDAHSGGRADHRCDFRRVVVVDGQDAARDDDVVSQVGREEGAHRPVDHARGQHAALARASLAAQVAARDAPDGVNLLLKVDAEREIVDAVARPGRGRGRHENGRLAVADEDGRVGQLRELADLQGQRPAGQRHGILLIVAEFSLPDDHEMLLSFEKPQSPST